MKFSTFTRTALAGVAALMICGSAAADTWRVATEGTFPPFEFYNSQTGEVQGFEVDLVKAMAQKMGKDLKLETLGFDAIIPGILSGTIDTGAAGFSITPERGKRVLFSIPFYKSGLTIVVPKGSTGIADFKDLEGKRISVQLGTTSMSYAKQIKGAKISTFINDKPVTDYILAQNKNLAAQTTHLKPIATADLFAMVMAKDNTKLKGEIDKALKDLKADGTFNKLHEKWFGVPADPELP